MTNVDLIFDITTDPGFCIGGITATLSTLESNTTWIIGNPLLVSFVLFPSPKVLTTSCYIRKMYTPCSGLFRSNWLLSAGINNRNIFSYRWDPPAVGFASLSPPVLSGISSTASNGNEKKLTLICIQGMSPLELQPILQTRILRDRAVLQHRQVHQVQSKLAAQPKIYCTPQWFWWTG